MHIRPSLNHSSWSMANVGNDRKAIFMDAYCTENVNVRTHVIYCHAYTASGADRVVNSIVSPILLVFLRLTCPFEMFVFSSDEACKALLVSYS